MSAAAPSRLHVNPSYKNIQGAIDYAEGYLEGAEKVAERYPLFTLTDKHIPCSLCLGSGLSYARMSFYNSHYRKVENMFIYMDVEVPCIQCNGTAVKNDFFK